jgi:hypothetical protein
VADTEPACQFLTGARAASLDRDRVGRGADAARRIHRRTDQECLVDAVGLAIIREILEPPQLAERHSELADEHLMDEPHRLGFGTEIRGEDFHAVSIGADGGRMSVPQVFAGSTSVQRGSWIPSLGDALAKAAD